MSFKILALSAVAASTAAFAAAPAKDAALLEKGRLAFNTNCAACHGEKGEGGLGPRLVGGQGTLKAPAQPVQTVGSYWPYATMLFDYVRRAMPYAQPKSLSNDEVYAAVAYMLSMNGIIKDTDVLNKDTIMKVQMPNKDGFIDLYPRKF